MKEEHRQLTKMKTIIREHSEQFYVKKLDNLDEVDKSLEIYALSKPPQEDMEKQNRQISSIQITNKLD